MFRPFRLLLLLCLASPLLRADIAPASRALHEGRVEEATSLLRLWLAQHPSDASAHLLLCRAFYAQELADPAIAECEAAAAGAPDSSEIQLWLGRAYGTKASSAHPIAAISLARKVRDAFERAVRLDPSNLDAASDLGEFYIAAPTLLGGGSSRARALAAKLRTLNIPAAEDLSHRILALLAEKDSDLPSAETEFRQATSTNSPARWIDLGAFYARHHQPDQALAAVHAGIAADKTRGPTLVDAASVLAEAARDPDLARRLLREYLASPARSDAAPVFKVHLQLGNLLAKAGNDSAAHKEYAVALALAPNFPPARKAASTQPQPSPPQASQLQPSNLQPSNLQTGGR